MIKQGNNQEEKDMILSTTWGRCLKCKAVALKGRTCSCGSDSFRPLHAASVDQTVKFTRMVNDRMLKVRGIIK